MSGHNIDRSYSSVVRRSKRGFSTDAIVYFYVSDQNEYLAIIPVYPMVGSLIETESNGVQRSAASASASPVTVDG